MHRAILILFPILAVFIFLSCHGDGTTGPNSIKTWTPDFFGSVYDNQGLPVANVGVHFIPHFTCGWNQYGLAKTTPTTIIEFALVKPGVVTLVVYRYGTDELIATLVDHQMMDEGMHGVSFDASLQTNGIYYYVLTEDGVVLGSRSMLFLPAPTKAYASQLIGTTGVAVTDADGKFNLPHSVFGIGTTYTRTNGDGAPLESFSILDTIDLILIKPGYQLFVQEVVVDTLHNTNGTYRLVPAIIR
jgi:hypothetical protein